MANTLVMSGDLRNILDLADKVALHYKEELSTLHILIAMLRIQPNTALPVLEQSGLFLKDDKKRRDRQGKSLLDIIEEMRKAAGPRGLSEPDDTMAFCRGKAFQLAASRNNPFVNPLFFLDAMLRLRRSLAFQAVEKAGVNLSRIRTRLNAKQANMRITRTIEPVSEEDVEEDRRSEEEATRIRNGDVEIGKAPPQRVEPGDGYEDGDEGDEEEERRWDGGETPFDLDEQRFPLLVSMTDNLTRKAFLGEIDPIIGRDKEIRQVIRTLLKRNTNNPCLVGEPGVGKTALAEGLAREIANRTPASAPLHHRVVLSLQTSSLVAGTSLRGSFSERMIQLRREVEKGDGRFIIFIDEIHTMVGAGSGDSALDAANELKAALSRGRFPCIGATTLKEYKKYIESDPALERRFQPVMIEEPSPDDTVKILRGVLPFYEEHHGIRYSPRAADAAVRLTVRYVLDRFLPDKAIEVLDFAGAGCKADGRDEVTEEDVAEVVSEKVGIPVEKLLLSAANRYNHLVSFLKERVVGHDDQLVRLADALKRGLAGLGGDRPLASFILVGPPGVGRSETARALGEFLFDDEHGIRIFEGVEYTEGHSVAKLVGTSPGYVGYEQGGQLTDLMYRRPFQILLFKDFSRAHPEVQELLGRLVATGKLMDGKGRTVAFSNTVLLFTMDADPDLFSGGAGPSVGFTSSTANVTEMSDERLWEKLGAAVPEVLRRNVDEALIYRPLTRPQALDVSRKLAAKLNTRLLAEKDIGVTMSDEALELLLERGGVLRDEGVRPMRRVLQVEVENRIAEMILSGEARRGVRVTVTREADGFKFLVRIP
ncbi:MAG: ATP-dependent Clp protease ATP-binding subunit [Pseudomonadota bacterium]